jgi:hypothetical protein
MLERPWAFPSWTLPTPPDASPSSVPTGAQGALQSRPITPVGTAGVGPILTRVFHDQLPLAGLALNNLGLRALLRHQEQAAGPSPRPCADNGSQGLSGPWTDPGQQESPYRDW